MEEFHHLSHAHPLTSFLNKEVDDDDDIEDQRAYLCSICGLPILSSPSYTCTVDDCKFFLHKPCAQLPQELCNPRHHHIERSPHTLHLKQKPDSQNFTYQCGNCEFNMHPLLAIAVEIKSKHRSHQSHPLVAICRETSSLCDACGEEHKGFFFSCQDCNFWIHQDCAVLPNFLELPSHHHPFFLSYSLSNIIGQLRWDPTCIICQKSNFSNHVGRYFCGQCNYLAHLSCAKSNMEKFRSEIRLELIQLPANEEDAFPSLVIRRYLESDPVPDDMMLTTIEKYHKHALNFHDRGFSSSSREACNLVCDVCVQPIKNVSSPFYRCPDCHFLAHAICANRLPNFIDIPIAWPRQLDLNFKASLFPNPSQYFFNSVLSCYFCHRPCSGICYYFDEIPVRCFFDLECITAPNSIKHASHSQHVVFIALWLDATPLRCCPSRSVHCDAYRCVLCDDFRIHVRCALLPKRTRHKFDEHPLELITSSLNKQDQHEYKHCFCEFCEEDIDRKYWYYGCGECEQYFHINCIPSVGYLSKVKFGGTFHDSNIHSHPLTLTRMLTVGRNERCGHCKKIIKGFVDEMAFHCSDCDFWIHFSCARDSSCAGNEISSRLRLYSEFAGDAEAAYPIDDY